MKYVLDASVALKWVLTEGDSPKALSIRDDFRNQRHELLLPTFFRLRSRTLSPAPNAKGSSSRRKQFAF